MISRENIIFSWLQFHFFDAPKSILKAWGNFLKFNLNYFSLFLLLKTLFSPWRRYYLPYGRRISLSQYFEAFTFNLFSRTIGAFLRSLFIIFGLISEIFLIFAGLVLFFGWLILPFLLIYGLGWGFKLLI